MYEALPATPMRRQLGTSTDDAAIFLEDTVDRVTAQCIDASPSALALLSPQHMPTSSAAHVDVTEYDANYLGPLSTSHRKSTGGSSSGSKGRPSHHHHRALHDVTNTSATKMGFSAASGSKSPTPKAVRGSTSHTTHPQSVSSSTSLTRSVYGRSPSASEPMVPLADYEALQRERNRYEKMYEHQRALYEDMAEKHADAYQALQDKIIEVVALSTRNEEGKRFIRQLKREMSESRTRVMDMQNRALEEAKLERSAKMRYEALIQEHERKYERLVERHEMKLAGMESLVRDLTSLRGERDNIHVSQLDSLLKAAYSKSTALFSDLLRQGKQIDLLYEAKAALEAQVEQQRKEKREVEATLREERRHMATEMERMIEQIEEQQQSILNLRQMLIRTMDNRDNLFAYSRGPRHPQSDEDHDGSDDRSHSSNSSLTSSPPISPIVDRGVTAEVTEDESEDTEGDGVYAVPARKEAKEKGADVERNPVRVCGAMTATGPITPASTVSTNLLSSNSVVAPRRTATVVNKSSATLSKARVTVVVPPLPLTSRDSSLSFRQGSCRYQRSKSDADEHTTVRVADDDHRLRQRSSSDEGSAANPRLADASLCTASAVSSVASRRRLDFTTALAVVAEKRRRDRANREENTLKHELDKENSKPTVPHRVIVRSCGAENITTARKTVLAEHDGDNSGTQRGEDEEAEPRLFPFNVLRPRE
ncbi:hypothetical protein LPMP_041070 [Leishmania panamensis]|uniref:Uncharacterized protein n=1 Tax=Leishmania panamensis TaxID=5679 RepID=A0A088RJS3_LEIPA|nr:hypothetical protein LPMP_041070 [Leishmania panamensis]AIN95429.1 hypothetical protein LPMP_041070 [Leishmania panamensis]